jgi:hypothetical protein
VIRYLSDERIVIGWVSSNARHRAAPELKY